MISEKCVSHSLLGKSLGCVCRDHKPSKVTWRKGKAGEVRRVEGKAQNYRGKEIKWWVGEERCREGEEGNVSSGNIYGNLTL